MLGRGSVSTLGVRYIKKGRGMARYLEQAINSSFEHEAIVDRDHTNRREAVPAGLSAPGDGGVHDVVGYQEVGLQLVKEG